MNIFELKSIREFLQKYLESLPKRGHGELAKISNALRVHPSLMSQILAGHKQLTVEQAHRLATYLQLLPAEKKFLLTLAQLERAGDKDLQEYLKAELEDIRKKALDLSRRVPVDKRLSEVEQAIFYSSWLYAAVNLFCGVGKGQTLRAIAERFSLPRERCQEILEFLVQCGLCRLEAGLFTAGSLSTHLAKDSPFLHRHHNNWRLQALRRAESISAEELMFSSPISLARKDFPILREEIVKLVEKMKVIVRDSPAEDVACLNMDLFWLR